MPVYVPNTLPGAVDPADLIEQLGAEIAARYAEAEAVMIARVAKLVAAGVNVPEDFIERQKLLTLLRREGAELAASLRDPAYVRQIIAIAAAQGEAAAIASLGLFADLADNAAGQGITATATRALGEISLDLSNRLDDMSARITRWMPDVYQRAIAMVSPNVILGIDTLAQAQRKAAERLIGQGVKGFEADNGAMWRIGTYAEMATRTSVNRAWMDANIFAMQEQGINLVSIIVGAGACPKCAIHSGKIYSTDGTPGGTYLLEKAVGEGQVSVTVAGTLGEARAQGWNHPNCRCVTVAYLPGLSIAEGSRYDPDKEAARDKLRGLERRVRELKRREAAAFDDVTRARIRRQIRQAQGHIRDHVKATGLLRRNYREQLSFSDGSGPGPLPTRPSVPKPRPVTPPSAVEAAPTPDAGLAAFVDVLAAARYANAREGIAAAETTNDLGKALNSTLYPLKFEGMTARVSLESAKEVATALVELLERFPVKLFQGLRFETIRSEGTIAQATAHVARRAADGKRYIRDASIQVSNRYAGATVRDEMLEALQDSTEKGHFHPHDGVAHLRYALIHEFGHVLDYVGQVRLRQEIPDILTAYRAEKGIPAGLTSAETSGYGATSYDELIAESFADVEINGDNARELSLVIHARLLAIYEEEISR